ncbi:MAG: hypothetical protein KJN81_06835 [Acidimicrobiia bacterium]|nr:hypothetical protein [Acidimicrobiia bacterium]NNL28131.1 hypothetical protein [Acidimicrobiia bacterium]
MSDGGEGILIRAAWQSGQALGVKLATIFPGNTELPSVHGVYVLFDGSNGSPVAIIDGTWLTWFKTSCDSALAADYLARSDAGHMLMVGAGAMAPHLIKAHLSVRPSIKDVVIWNRTPERASELASALAAELDGVSVSAVTDLESAVGEADVISSATMTVDPLIYGDWLQPGTHLDLVGAYTPGMREADDVAIARTRVFVDSRDTTIGEIGELIDPIANGTITEADVLADLYQLCQGSLAGRTSDDEITLFKNGGGGHLDLMTAQFVMSQL